MGWLRNKRNKKWAKRLGWSPVDFDSSLKEDQFDNALAIAITYFQREVKSGGHDIDVDGVCGPATFRFLKNENTLPSDSKLSDKMLNTSSNDAGNNGTSLLINGKWVDIGWKTLFHSLPKNCYKTVKKQRTPTVVVVHHDVCLSAEKCHYVLKKSKNSTHICIDNDGTIHQFVDLNDITWHAGVSYYRKHGAKKRYSSRNLNNSSIGVDFSNAWYPKYNKQYVNMGFEKRKLIKDSKIHGVKISPHLDMYPVQIEAFKHLSKFLTDHFDIPAEVPLDDNGDFKRGWVEECMKGEFKGFQVHFNSSINKIDTDINLKELVEND